MRSPIGLRGSHERREPTRDRSLRGALERELPVLGICRGMQILNVALGGTLEQDLVAADGTHPHRKVRGTFDGNDHTVTLTPGSLAARAVGERVHLAHCHHHQAVRALGSGLVVSGRADDGVVEAIDLADGRWGSGLSGIPKPTTRAGCSPRCATRRATVSEPRTR
jgi:putative glutamine amidotransferase